MSESEKTVRLRFEITSDTRGGKEAVPVVAGIRKETEKLGTSSEKAAKETRKLDDEVKQLEGHIVDLGKAYAETGDKSLFKQIRSDRSQITQIERIKKDLGEVETASEAAAGGISSLIKLNTEAFSAVPFKPILIGGLVGLGALLAPAIGAAVSGAVVGIGGVGGIAGGIASASKNPLVRSAAQKFGAEISADFFGSASSTAFVKPTIDALDILGRDFKSLDLGSAFAKAAPFLDNLAHGVGDFAKNIMPGFNAIMDKSGAIVSVLSMGFADTGSAISSFLTDVASSKGSLEGLQYTFKLIDGSVVALGHGLKFMGDQFDAMLQLDTSLGHFYQDAFGWVPFLGDSLRSTNRNLADLTGSGEGASREMHTFNRTAVDATQYLSDLVGSTDAAAHAADRYRTKLQDLTSTVDDFLGKTLHVDEANLAVAKGFQDLNAGLKQNGDAWDTSTAKGAANEALVLRQIRLLQDQRDAAIAAGDQTIESKDKATRAYDEQITKLLAIAKAAGASKAELDKLKGDYYINIHTRSILETVGGITGTGNGVYDQQDQHHQHRAMGGPVMAGQAYLVGESGPEPFIPNQNGTILPHSALRGLTGAQRVELVLRIAGGDDEFTRFFRKIVSVTAGGDVQTYVTG